ncbi:MAG: hypothetical protein M1834_006580 [Cirrosporium novae-zelandiae]|nr:MAG: hypothetical protein M1834_006580 [Cirrosporium novae-zelandiae]
MKWQDPDSEWESDFGYDPPTPPRVERRGKEKEKEKGKEKQKPETMSSWLERQATSHNAQLALTAVASGALVAGAIFGFQSIRRQAAVEELKASIPDLDEHYQAEKALRVKLTEYGTASPVPLSPRENGRSTLALRAKQGDYDNDLIHEQLARNKVFLTDEGLAKLRSSFVIVVGCGGVGSHATAALARSGVSKIRLIDFDQVTLSSLNRHALATLADVGTPKVHCIRKHMEQIVPWVHFDCRNELFSEDVAATQLEAWDGKKPDFIVDAIDNIESKVALLHYCYTNSLPVISSMGAGCKSDPTRIFVGDISASIEDPLSRSVRVRLRQKGITKGIPVVFSTEKPGPGKAQLMPLADEEFEKGEVGELGVLPDFRVRILPVLGTMPAVFGYSVANHVIMEITGYPHEYLPSKGREKMYDGILANLQGIEERLARWAGEDALGLRIPVNKNDVGYLVEEVYKGKSVVTSLPTRLVLIRWEASSDYTPDQRWDGQKVAKLNLNDLVVMTKDEAVKHETLVLKEKKSAEEVYGSEVVELVKRRMKEEEVAHGSPTSTRFRRTSGNTSDNDFRAEEKPSISHQDDEPSLSGTENDDEILINKVSAYPSVHRPLISFAKNKETKWQIDEKDPEGDIEGLRRKPWMRAAYPRFSRRPLIDSIQNVWKTDPQYGQINPEEEEENLCRPWWRSVLAVIRNPKVRRFTMWYLILFCVIVTVWRTWGKNKWEEHRLLANSLNKAGDKGWWGSNTKPIFSDLTLVKDLDKKYLPGGSKKDERKRRLVFVGDVHGCKEELKQLLKKVDFHTKSDHLILTGDMISKGPDSAGVVDLARKLKASGVRGNHEDRILLMRKDRNSMASTVNPNAFFKTSDHKHLARKLSSEQVEYLKSLPVILRVGELSGMGEVVVVHAGLVPGVQLSYQDPSSAMTMRSLDLETHTPSKEHAKGHKDIWWAKLWNKYQGRVSKKYRTTVVYGHDSKMGLQIKKYTRGLDTSCVYGGHLTALIIEEGKWGYMKETVMSVKCRTTFTNENGEPKAIEEILGESNMGQQ